MDNPTVVSDSIRKLVNITTVSKLFSLRTTTKSPFISPFKKRASVIIILRVRPKNDPLAITLPNSQYWNVYPEYYTHCKQINQWNSHNHINNHNTSQYTHSPDHLSVHTTPNTHLNSPNHSGATQNNQLNNASKQKKNSSAGLEKLFDEIPQPQLPLNYYFSTLNSFNQSNSTVSNTNTQPQEFSPFITTQTDPNTDQNSSNSISTNDINTDPNSNVDVNTTNTSKDVKKATKSQHKSANLPQNRVENYPRWISPLNHAKWLSQPWVQNGDLEICFIKRAFNPRDIWSCQMGFPGGRQDKGESDLWTGIREVQEEIGLDLTNTRQFTFISRLDDIQVENVQQNNSKLSVSTFVFLQVCPVTPSLFLAPKEVSQLLWVPLRVFGLGTDSTPPQGMSAMATLPPSSSSTTTTSTLSLSSSSSQSIQSQLQSQQGKRNDTLTNSIQYPTQPYTTISRSNKPNEVRTKSLVGMTPSSAFDIIQSLWTPSQQSTASILDILWSTINPISWFATTRSALRGWVNPRYRITGREYIFLQYLKLHNIDNSLSRYELVYCPRAYLHSYVWRHQIEYIGQLDWIDNNTSNNSNNNNNNTHTHNNNNPSSHSSSNLLQPVQSIQDVVPHTNILTPQIINNTTHFTQGWWSQQQQQQQQQHQQQQQSKSTLLPPSPSQFLLPQPQYLNDLLYLINDVPILPIKEFEHTTYTPRFRDYISVQTPQQQRFVIMNPTNYIDVVPPFSPNNTNYINQTHSKNDTKNNHQNNNNKKNDNNNIQNRNNSNEVYYPNVPFLFSSSHLASLRHGLPIHHVPSHQSPPLQPSLPLSGQLLEPSALHEQQQQQRVIQPLLSSPISENEQQMENMQVLVNELIQEDQEQISNANNNNNDNENNNQEKKNDSEITTINNNNNNNTVNNSINSSLSNNDNQYHPDQHQQHGPHNRVNNMMNSITSTNENVPVSTLLSPRSPSPSSTTTTTSSTTTTLPPAKTSSLITSNSIIGKTITDSIPSSSNKSTTTTTTTTMTASNTNKKNLPNNKKTPPSKALSTAAFIIPIRFPCILLPGVGLRTVSRLQPESEYQSLYHYSSQQQLNQAPMITLGTPETMLWGLTLRNVANFIAIMQLPLLHNIIEYDNEYRRYILNLYIQYSDWWSWAFGPTSTNNQNNRNNQQNSQNNQNNQNNQKIQQKTITNQSTSDTNDVNRVILSSTHTDRPNNSNHTNTPQSARL